MNAERLARLLVWSDTQAHVYGDGVKRLAQERETLLNAVRYAVTLVSPRGVQQAALDYLNQAIAEADTP